MSIIALIGLVIVLTILVANVNTLKMLLVINLITDIIILTKSPNIYFFIKSNTNENIVEIKSNNVSNTVSIKFNNALIPSTINLHKSNSTLTMDQTKNYHTKPNDF